MEMGGVFIKNLPEGVNGRLQGGAEAHHDPGRQRRGNHPTTKALGEEGEDCEVVVHGQICRREDLAQVPDILPERAQPLRENGAQVVVEEEGQAA